jgi:integrase
MLAELLRTHIGERTSGRLFLTRTGAAISGNNIRRRILQPMLIRLGIKKAGLHAFRHARVTMLRKNGTPADLQRQWIGHASTRTTDGYSHLDQEREYRKTAASAVGLGLILGRLGPPLKDQAAKPKTQLKATA